MDPARTRSVSATGSRPDGADDGDRARDRRIEAEEAAAAYWRSVAADRRTEAARVQHRPIVRAAIALDRRSRGVQDRAVAAALRVRSTGERLAARATPALGPIPAVDVEPTPDDDVAATVLAVGPRGSVPRGARLVDRSALDDAVAAASHDVIVLLAPGTTPTPGWLAPLVEALARDDVVAAVPCSTFPVGTPTRHHGQVRSAGGRAVLVDDAPVSVPLPASTDGEASVDLALGGAIALTRADWSSVGGLGPVDDVTGAIVDLGLRLTAGGGELVAVTASRVVEADEPRRRVELRERPPSDGPVWAAIVDRHGPALRRMARASGHPVTGAAGPSVTITTATPSRKIAAHSGDWHYAGLLTEAFERTGIDARRQPIAEVGSAAGRSRDVHLVLRGLEPVVRTPGQVHVLWVISHPEALTVAECDDADLVLVASERFAEHLRDLTSTPVEVVEQATDPRRFTPDAATGPRIPLTVVANTRGVRRTSVDAAIVAGHRPRIHGLGWEGLVDPALVAGGYLAFDDLPAIYASSDVVLNDHWDTMRLWGFVSNRILDATAAGAVVISDHLPEVEARFGDLIPTWRNADELGELLERQRADPDSFRERAAAARELVLGAHTFDHRVREIDDLLRRHGLHPAPDAT